MARWEAERAGVGRGWLQVNHQQASGGAFVESERQRTGGELRFRFETREPMTLRVNPVWWRSGDRRPATRYPYPYEPQIGPRDLVAAGGKLFFAAPSASRVGYLDLSSGQLAGHLDLDGYVSSLAADATRGLVFAADALGNRVVVIDAGSAKEVGTWATPAEPWHLLLAGDSLYVACRSARQVVRLSLDSGRVTATAQLDAEPLRLEPDAQQGRVLVRFEAQLVHLIDLEQIPTDDPSYTGFARRTSLRAKVGNQWVTVSAPKPATARLQIGSVQKDLDVAAVTAGPAAPGTPADFQERRGPDVFVASETTCWFTAPAAGRVGIIDLAAQELTGSIEVGGTPSDLELSPAGDKLYVADAALHLVHVVSVKDAKVVASLPVPEVPVALVAVREVAIQRPNLESPAQVQKVFVASRAGKAISVIDIATDQVVKTIPLNREPRHLLAVSMPATGWWGPIPQDRTRFRLTPKLAVETAPLLLSADLGASEHANVSPNPPRPTPVPVAVGTGDGRVEVNAVPAGDLLLKLGDQLVDVSEVADPQLVAPPALRPSDRPGAITLSVNGGEQFDWQRSIDMSPDSQMFLYGDSPSFWRWNAQAFTLPAGRHTLTVTATAGEARLDALEVWRDNGPELTVGLRPEPWAEHQQVRLFGYRGVFYDTEPIEFSLQMRNQSAQPTTAQVSWRLHNYMGEVVRQGDAAHPLAAGAEASRPMRFEVTDWGRYRLALRVVTPAGMQEQDHYFLRMPKLEHPRLMFRRDQLPEVEARIKEHQVLFDRYRDWLVRQVSRPGERYPERFLPAGPTTQDLNAMKPEGSRGRFDWRMYELGWRMVGVQFAAKYLGDESGRLAEAIAPMLAAKSTNYYCTYHHHGPFFPGAVAALYDMADEAEREASGLKPYFERYYGDKNVIPWMLVTMEEPLTAQDRAVLYKLMNWENFAEEYFTSHTGETMGKWWQNPWTGCHCTNHGLYVSFLYLRNFFNEPRLYEKPMFRALFTYQRYVEPQRDNRRLLPASRGPLGEPMRWLNAALGRHPLEKALYPWDQWVDRLSGELGASGEEPALVDDLFALKGLPLSGPIGGNANHFHTGVAVPFALAAGWYDPSGPTVQTEELPPTALAEADGWVPMRSHWGPDSTEVTFVCGRREHTSRERAGHLSINHAGEFLLGTPALVGDDGNNTCSWANTVVVDDEWEAWWRTNILHPRDGEYFVANRFSQATWAYIARDRALTGYKPAESGWGGGLDLHGHTQTPYLQEGTITAFGTWPEFDYVAGDTTNAWPLDKVADHQRQLVYLRPGTVVVYDRVKLGANGRSSRWLATTPAAAEVDGQRFQVTSGEARLEGEVLLPAEATISTPTPYREFLWKGQQVLSIEPVRQTNEIEYLVVLRAGAVNADAVVVMPRGAAGWQVNLASPTAEPAKDVAGRDWFAADYAAPADLWQPHDAPMGYGDQTTYASTLADNDGNYYLRRTVELPELPVGQALLRVASDNAARVWINGQLVDDDPAIATPGGHEFAYWNREVPVPSGLLRPGANTVAVYLYNEATSSDVFFDCELAVLPEPAGGAEANAAWLLSAAGRVGVKLPTADGPVTVMFDRSGAPGGSVAVAGRPAVELPRTVANHYRNWRTDPRHRAWTSEPRFDFLVKD